MSTLQGITIDKDMDAPIYVYLKLTNFYQNHKDMMRSLDRKQLERVRNG